MLQILRRAQVQECKLTKPFPDVLRSPWMGTRQNYLVYGHEKCDPFWPTGCARDSLGITHMHESSKAVERTDV